MAGITIKIKRDDTPQRLKTLEGRLSRAVRKGAAFLEGRLKASMAEPKTGPHYGKHQASAPGESPAIDSGNLAGSISMIFPTTLEAKIGTNVAYATYLETGTSRMAQRPLWEKTAHESMPTLESMFANELND